MATITQDMRYRLSLIKYAEKFGVTKAAIKYKTSGRFLGQTHAARIFPLHPRFIPVSAQAGHDGCEACESQVRCQTL